MPSIPLISGDHLKTAQRLHRISPHFATVDAMRTAGHLSVQSVYFQGRDTFISSMTNAFGSAGPHGTLAATTVQQGSQLPHLDKGGKIARLHNRGCSPAAITTAALFTRDWGGR